MHVANGRKCRVSCYRTIYHDASQIIINWSKVNTMLNSLYKTLVITLLCLTFASLAFAEGMKVEPGLWETKSQVTSPGGTHENVTQDCIKETEFSPENMMDKNSGCEVTDSSFDAKSMQWTLSCENQGVTMTGNGHAKSTGTSVVGGMDMNANFGGQQVSMTTKWEGNRIGDCK